ncbi:MAG: hypothetical protein LW698_14095, partial [Planctomycetaceae bacterium]|nr:hypothetical protein [Planctomycetaceae bacterium]
MSARRRLEAGLRGIAGVEVLGRRKANPVFARLTPRPAGQTVEGGTGSGWPAAGMAGRLLRHS